MRQEHTENHPEEGRQQEYGKADRVRRTGNAFTDQIKGQAGQQAAGEEKQELDGGGMQVAERATQTGQHAQGSQDVVGERTQEKAKRPL